MTGDAVKVDLVAIGPLETALLVAESLVVIRAAVDSVAAVVDLEEAEAALAVVDIAASARFIAKTAINEIS